MGERRAVTNKLAGGLSARHEAEKAAHLGPARASSPAGTGTTPGPTPRHRRDPGRAGAHARAPRVLRPGGLGPGALLAGGALPGGQAAGADAPGARPAPAPRRRARAQRDRGGPAVRDERRRPSTGGSTASRCSPSSMGAPTPSPGACSSPRSPSGPGRSGTRACPGSVEIDLVGHEGGNASGSSASP